VSRGHVKKKVSFRLNPFPYNMYINKQSKTVIQTVRAPQSVFLGTRRALCKKDEFKWMRQNS
jgi:hypothetical protein